MGIKLWTITPGLVLLIALGSASIGEPNKFVVSQASLEPPAVELYVDALDQNGEALSHPSRSDFSADFLGQALVVGGVKSFDSSGQGIAYIFLVDVSKSIQRPQFAEMRSAIDSWIDGLNGNDHMTILTFGEAIKTLIDFTDDKALLKAALQTVEPTDLKTRLYLALNDAENLIARSDASLPKRRVVVIVSDGKDEGSGYTDTDIRDLVTRVHIPIYAIGSSRLPVNEREQYLAELKRLALLSGGEYTTGDQLTSTYDQLKQAIKRVLIVDLTCSGCKPDMQDHPLALTLTSGNAKRTALLPVKMLFTPPDPWWKEIRITIPVSLGLALAVAVPIYIKFFRTPSPDAVVEIHEMKQFVVVQEAKGRLLRLTIVSGKDHGRVYEVRLAGTAVVGRDEKCEASFPDDAEMSARHCEFIEDGSKVEVEDLGSTNGTLLNGARLVGRQKLASGDLVRAGRTEFRVTFGGS